MSDVSRETSELREHFSAFPDLDRYAGILATRGVERGLIGPREAPRIWPRHIANCAVVALEGRDIVPDGVEVADVGSGAGLPGVVWAIVRPDLTVTLIEPLLRRSTFLAEVVAELGLAPRVRVARTRAEELRGVQFDVVTARAVARLDRLAQWTLPLCRVGGRVVALKGEDVASEIREARDLIGELGGGPPEVRLFGSSLLHPPTTAVVIARTPVDVRPVRSRGRS